MADKKISDLTPLQNVSGNEEFPVAYNGENYKVKVKDVKPDMSDYVTSKQAAQKYYPKVDGDNLSDLVDTLNEGLGHVEKDLAESYVKKDGTYEDLTAGTAINLEGKTDIVNASMYRPTGGNEDVLFGTASIENIQGNAVAWNQLVKNGNFVNTSNWSTNRCSISVSSNTITLTRTEEGDCFVRQQSEKIQGHKYIAICETKQSVNEANNTFYATGLGFTTNIASQDWKRVYIIGTGSGLMNVQLFCVNPEVGSTATFRNVQLFDLTLIYGAGNEPTTAEQFEADYQRWFGRNLEYEEYDEGSIRTVLATGIKTVGFNLWPYGDYTGSTSNWTGKYKIVNNFGYTDRFLISADIKVENDSEFTSNFRITYTDNDVEWTGFTGSGKLSFFTKSGKIVSSIESSKNQNTHDIIISNICISMVWSGKRDGDYEPYWEETQPLPITTLTSGGKVIFPDGLKRAGNVYDEIYTENGVTKAVKRVGSVDLGTLDLIKTEEIYGIKCVAAKIKGAIFGANKHALISRKYGFVPISNFAKTEGDNYTFFNGTSTLIVRDDNFVENEATDFEKAKRLLNGIILYYSLEEPETYIIDNFSLPVVCKIDDFGTEQVLSPENGITPVLTSKYGINAVDTLRRLPQRYISAESDNDFLAKLGAELGGTWSKQWSNELGMFKYEHTGESLYKELHNGKDGQVLTSENGKPQWQDLTDLLTYGIEFDENVSSPTCTRIGNTDLHRTLPVHSLMRGCILDDDGHVVKYLPQTNWAAEDTNGEQGQVMVELPEYYRRFDTDGTKHSVRISLHPFAGAHKVPKKYVSAYEATVDRDEVLTPKLASVKSKELRYRGGNNNSTLDADGEKSQLGLPATNVSRTNFRTYARNRKENSTAWNCMTYGVQKDIYWLFVVEYATLNSQAAYNAHVDAAGFRQGGLGAGVTTINGTKWNDWNSYNPFVPCGYTDEFGNMTGVKNFKMPAGYDTAETNVSVPRYRGIENPFGHIWKWTDGVNIRIAANNDSDPTSKVYVCENAAYFQDTDYDGYRFVGLLPRTEGYIKTIHFGDNGDIVPSAVGGGSTTYFCDYSLTSLPTSGEVLRGVLFCGAAHGGMSAGIVTPSSSDNPSNAAAYRGSRLCFLPE